MYSHIGCICYCYHFVQVIALNQCYHVVYEKDILMSINCTFVVKMYHTFKVGNWVKVLLLSVDAIM